MNGLQLQETVALTMSQLMETNILGQTSGRLTKECLQNINLMIDNQLFLKQTSNLPSYLLVNQQLSLYLTGFWCMPCLEAGKFNYTITIASEIAIVVNG